MKAEGKPRLAQCTVRIELACARALLDELEAVLDAESEERIRRDVAVQIADQLARVASTMTRWEARSDDDSPKPLHGESLSVVSFNLDDDGEQSEARESDTNQRNEETEDPRRERSQETRLAPTSFAS